MSIPPINVTVTDGAFLGKEMLTKVASNDTDTTIKVGSVAITILYGLANLVQHGAAFFGFFFVGVEFKDPDAKKMVVVGFIALSIINTIRLMFFGFDNYLHAIVIDTMLGGTGLAIGLGVNFLNV